MNLTREVSGLAEFLGGVNGWYTVDADNRSVKTMFLARNKKTSHVLGEHGF
jgi:hypothetical protein